jgi:apolipoprotein N-acyltransferase
MSVKRYGLLGALLLWSAFPPLSLWPMAWIAPICWLALIQAPRLQERKAYWTFYGVSLLHWLAVIQWVRLPHWSCYFGWLALSAYLAVYPLLFLTLGRWAVQRLKWPLVLACPLIWAGLELTRSRFLTGFAMATLGHSQVSSLPVLQFADLSGTTGLGFVIILCAAALLEALTRPQKRWRWLGLAGGIFAAVWCYGAWRMDHVASRDDSSRTARVAIIQGSIDTTFSDADDPDKSFQSYLELSRQAVDRDQQLDLMIWPESMFSTRYQILIDVEPPIQAPDAPDVEPDELEQRLRAVNLGFEDKARWVSQQLHVPLLVGCERLEYGPYRPRRYNSALWIDEEGQVQARYDKMHPVLFGEYVPLANVFPVIYDLLPVKDSLTSGVEPIAIDAGDLAMSPCICFENTVPQLIRRQVVQLAARDQEPDVLVTITNDGWFWGSGLLDAHLACGILRAVELRKPSLIAANTGFSAVIDATGRVEQQGPRRAQDVLLATVAANDASSGYRKFGDWLGWLGVATCGVCLLASRRNTQS